MNGDLAGLCPECKTFDANNVSEVKKFFPNDIIQCAVAILCEIILSYIELYASLRILQHRKGSLAHVAHTHDATCKANIIQGLFIIVTEPVFYFNGIIVDRI